MRPAHRAAARSPTPTPSCLVEEVQAEYVVRYGGRDQTPIDPREFEAPPGAFFVGYRDGVPVDDGRAGGVRPTSTALGAERAAEVKRMYVAPAARRRGLARLMLAHLEATAAHGRRRRDHPRDRARAARGDGALRVRRLSSRSSRFGYYRDSDLNRCFGRRI